MIKSRDMIALQAVNQLLQVSLPAVIFRSLNHRQVVFLLQGIAVLQQSAGHVVRNIPRVCTRCSMLLHHGFSMKK